MSSPSRSLEDYPLQNTKLDVPLDEVLAYTKEERQSYIRRLLRALAKKIDKNEMALKRRVPFAKEMRDLRKLLHSPTDKYLFTEDANRKQWVLGKGAPGGTHTYWSRKHMWQMETDQGNLEADIRSGNSKLVNKLDALFDGAKKSKALFRTKTSAVDTAISFLQTDRGVGAAFPPFHARFLCDEYLPPEGECLVIDPCAGWGGRLLGTLAVPRKSPVKYFGIDPEQRNSVAYEGLERRINVWLKKEISGPRSAEIAYQPFEEWIVSKQAKSFRGKADLVMTSPPYFGAEKYNPDNENQSINTFPTYGDWREGFYRVLVEGAYDLLKPNGVFVLNIANVPSCKHFERDARELAREAGFENEGFYKLAMSKVPGTHKLTEKKSGRKQPHFLSVDGVSWKYEPVFVFRKPENAKAKPRKRSKPSVAKSNSLSWEQIRSLYNDYDAHCNDSFRKIKKGDDLNLIWDKGRPLAGFTAKRRRASGYECLYKGRQRSVPCISYKSGDYEVSKFVAFDRSTKARKAIVKRLKELPKPCVIELFSTALYEKELLTRAGFEFADASVNSFGDIYHIFINSQDCSSRRIPVPEYDRVGIKQFAQFDFQKEVLKIAKR